MSQYFPPYRSFGGNIKVELDLSSYATKTDLKNVTHVDFSSFVSKANLASLKIEVEINKIKAYFNSEIQKRKTMCKKLSKYIAAFDYIDKTLIALFVISGGISIFYFTSIIGVPAGLASASFTLVFSLTT